jgi:hypothetical protein
MQIWTRMTLPLRFRRRIDDGLRQIVGRFETTGRRFRL